MPEWKHKCLCSVLTYQPQPWRPDCLTIGFILFDPAGEKRVSVRFLNEFDELTRIDPDVDGPALEACLLAAEPQLITAAINCTNPGHFSLSLGDILPPQINVLPPVALLTQDFDREIENQTKALLGFPPPRKAERTESRCGVPFLKKQIRSTLVEYGVWDHLDKDISVERFTLKQDAYKIQCGYRNPSSNTYRMVDPVSLAASTDKAKILALSWPLIRDGISRETTMNCEFYAIVEDGLEDNRNVALGKSWMKEVGIRVSPLSAMPILASEARTALRL
jgi:hypothetical protein